MILPVRPLAVRKRIAASIIGVGVTKLDALIAEGQIEAVKSGKSLLIIYASLEAYLTSLPRAELKLPKHMRRTS